MTGYSIRKAANTDAPVLWTWRNDLTTRRMERSPAVVPWERYCDWLAMALADCDRALLIAETRDTPASIARPIAIGHFALSGFGGWAEFGIILAPSVRGRRLATPLIDDFCAVAEMELGFDRVLAEIRVENLPSRAAFRRAGFHEHETVGGITRFRRTFGQRQATAS